MAIMEKKNKRNNGEFLLWRKLVITVSWESTVRSVLLNKLNKIQKIEQIGGEGFQAALQGSPNGEGM